MNIAYEAKKMLDKNATVTTDGKTAYRTLKDICKLHKAIIITDKTKVSKIFPWLHTAISNAKKKLLALHHHVNDKYMQNYLNEFYYKSNWRYFGIKLFDRLVVAAISTAWYKSCN